MIESLFKKRKEVIRMYLSGNIFVRFVYKIQFLFGVLLVIATSFLLGRYPNNYYYYNHIITVNMLIILRFLNYRTKGRHYYFYDFCYFANFIVDYFICFAPKNDYIFKIFFAYVNGPFGIAVATFRNSMIFHKLDNLTAIILHLVPMITSWNLKWHTLPD